jgi:hypothetical protein
MRRCRSLEFERPRQMGVGGTITARMPLTNPDIS